MATVMEDRDRAFADRFPLHLDDVRFHRDAFLYGFGSRETGRTVAASGFRLRGPCLRAAARLLRLLGLRADPIP